MKKALRKGGRSVLFLGIGFFLVWLVTKDLTSDQWLHVKDAFRRADYIVLIPALLVGILSHLIRAARWRLLFEPLGYMPRFFVTFSAVMIGYLTNLAVLRLGEMARCGVLTRQEGIPLEKALGTVLAERIIDALCVFVIIFFTLLILPPDVKAFFYEGVLSKVSDIFHFSNASHWFLLAGGVLLLLVFLAYLFRKTSGYQKVKKVALGIKEGLITAFKLKKVSLFLILTVLMWGSYFLMIYIGFFAFKPTSSLGWREALSVLSSGSIGMIVTQGGLGAYQLLVQKTLELYGISEIFGFAFGWLSWIMQTGLILVLGVASFAMLSVYKRKKQRKGI